jgi:twitching motility protein PilT
MCLVNQRELGPHTHSFANALRAVLREDPDIILVGEMRDLETIQLAITAAETGHLVFGTLHSPGAPQTVDRVIDVFPAGQQAQIRTQFADSIEAIVTQTLCKKKGGGRVAALEILVATTAVRNLIREGKVHQIPSAMQVGQKDGMQTMDMALVDLVNRGVITREEAQAKSMTPNLFGQPAMANGKIAMGRMA